MQRVGHLECLLHSLKSVDANWLEGAPTKQLAEWEEWGKESPSTILNK
jgi:hypothetical protein